ncbi:MAG TPA: methyltransferase domain-containing protein [Planktothrix sp.]|jgi:ubiquinone/menaquinone biosynthesis C-methylase UbiE/uncharacterized protein YbaR (Trm112 family)
MAAFDYRCPLCKGSLSHTVRDGGEAYSCSTCAQRYPVIAGIADFRVYSDPYIDLESDRNKGLRLVEQAKKVSFEELLKFYYSITPEVPADLAQYYTNHHLAGVTRGAGILRRFLAYGLRAPATGERVIDLGCGTGGFLAAAAAQTGGEVIGVDVAFRWLVVARKRLEELGHKKVQLVCACADYLPFAENFADAIVAENLIEHVRNQRGLFAEIGRVRSAQSRVMARTVNRFAFGPEPHVGVWGVGYLPRHLMNGYVSAIKKIPYEHIHLQSQGELRSYISSSGQDDLAVSGALLSRDDYAHHSPARQIFFKTYSGLVQSRTILSGLATSVGPYLDVVSKPVRVTAPQHERVLVRV